MPLSERPPFWQEHIKQNDKLGISAAAYAKRHSLDIKRYYYWRKRLINEKPSKLMPIAIEPAAKRRLTITIETNGDFVIAGADREQVAQVIASLFR